MEEERIKSALEIAMERLSELPELTPEEIAEQKEKEYTPIGETLGNRYLRGTIDGDNLVRELRRRVGESEPIVRRALVSTLCGAIRFDDPGTSEKALSGLAELARDPASMKEEAFSVWNRLYGDFRRQAEGTLRELEIAAKKRLADVGIAGTAVRPNLTENEVAKQGLEDLRRSFDPDLEKLRALLTERTRNPAAGEAE